MKFPRKFHKYFWEVDAEKLDFKEYPEYVTARILEYGDLEASRWLLRSISSKTIKNVLLQRRGLSPKTRSFWASFFNLPKKLWWNQFYQKRQGITWPY